MSDATQAAAARQAPAASVRLTETLRAGIVQSALRHRFATEILAQRPSWAALAADAYDRLYPEPVRRQMAKLPEGWLREGSYVNVQLGSAITHLRLDGGMEDCLRRQVRGLAIPEPVSRRFQERRGVSGIVLALDATDPLSIRHDRLRAEHRDLHSRIARATSQLEAALRSASTTSALVRDWPEISPFLPARAQAPTTSIAIRRGDLNELLGLPAAEPVGAMA